jgi:hypothetical protein
MKEDTHYLNIPLEEMQRSLDHQRDSFDTIKTTVRSVLSAASLIVSLVGALQLINSRIAPAWLWLYWIGIAVTATLYVALILFSVVILMPIIPSSPLAANWDVLTTAFKDLDEKEMKLKQLSSILNAIEKNKPILDYLVKLQRFVLILLPFIVVILLLLSLLPRI